MPSHDRQLDKYDIKITEIKNTHLLVAPTSNAPQSRRAWHFSSTAWSRRAFQNSPLVTCAKVNNSSMKCRIPNIKRGWCHDYLLVFSYRRQLCKANSVVKNDGEHLAICAFKRKVFWISLMDLQC